MADQQKEMLRRRTKPWKTLLVDYTQETTLHGMCYVTKPSTFVCRKLFWALAVTCALTTFAAFAVTRILYFYSYPKTVNVEVTFETKLPFPAVTVCNQNMFRLTQVQELGLYDTLEDTFSGQSKHSSLDCKDRFIQMNASCMPSHRSDLDNTFTYVEVTLKGCQALCTQVHSQVCSVIYFDPISRSCMLTQDEKNGEEIAPNPYVIVHKYRKIRCTDDREFFCDFEEYEECPLTQAKDDQDDWVTIRAQHHQPRTDHSSQSPEGFYQYLVEMKSRPGYRAAMATNYKNTTDMCLEVYHQMLGTSPGVFSLKVRTEDSQEVTLLEARALTSKWKRMMVPLPAGVYQVMIEGTRSTEGASGMAVDDIRIAPCLSFEDECRRTYEGEDYMGNQSLTATGKQCLAKGDIDDTKAANYSSCRNAELRSVGPHCNVGGNILERCDIPFCDCPPNYFRCSSGFCLPDHLVCNGQEECRDGSDEITPCGSKVSLVCDFRDNFLCSYKISNYDLPNDANWHWAPSSEKKKMWLGRSSIDFQANALELNGLGDLGDKALLSTPLHDFWNGSCIQLYVHLHDELGHELNGLKIYLNDGDRFTARLLVDIAEDPNVPAHAWRHLQVPVLAGRHGLVVEATVGNPETAAIGVSHVSQLEECRTQDSHSVYYTPEDTFPTDLQLQANDGPFNVKYTIWSSTAFYNWEEDWTTAIDSTPSGTGEIVLTSGDGAPCHFPFMYGGLPFYGCISNKGQYTPWCGTTYNYDSDGLYGQCIVIKWTSDGQMSLGSYCHFPFVYKGKVYNSCTTVDSHRPWCATTPDYHKTKQYGYCMDYCGGYWTSRHGILRSPNYPSRYPSQVSCIYHIVQEPGVRIKLHFDTFGLEPHHYCDYDYLSVWDSADSNAQLLGDLCGHTLPEDILSPSNTLWIRFTSDMRIVGTGFTITYTTFSDIVEDQGTMLVARAMRDRSFMNTAKAYLVSPVEEIDVDSCLSISYFNREALNIYYGTTHGLHVPLVYIPKTQYSAWSDLHIDLSAPSDLSYIYMEALHEDHTGDIITAAVEHIELNPGRCEDLVLNYSINCDFTPSDSCGYLDQSDSPIRWLRMHEMAGYSMVVHIPASDEGTSARLLLPFVTLLHNSCLNITLRSEYKTATLPENSYFSLSVETLGETPVVVVDLYKWLIQGVDRMWIQVELEPGAFRPSLIVQSAIEIDVFIENVEVEICDIGDENYYVQALAASTSIAVTSRPEVTKSPPAMVFTKDKSLRNPTYLLGPACVFPFKYKGTVYSKCLPGQDYGDLWCPTSTNYEEDYEWGYCKFENGTIHTHGGTFCTFPFLYDGVEHHSCITQVALPDRPWCGLTYNYPKDKKSGYCKMELFQYKLNDTFTTTTLAPVTEEMNRTEYDAEDVLDVLPTDHVLQLEMDLEPGPAVITDHTQATDFTSLANLYLTAGHELEDFVYSCSWSGRPCANSSVTRLMTDMGACITFNGMKEQQLFTDTTGAGFGLSFTFNIEQYQYINGPNTDAGVKVFLHSPGALAAIRDQGFAVSPGIHSLVGIQYTTLDSLSTPYGTCGHVHLDYYPEEEYSYLRCQRQCVTRLIEDQCNCIDAFMPGPSSVCNLTQFLDCLYRVEYVDGLNLVGCEPQCVDECERAAYEYAVSYASLSSLSVDNIIRPQDMEGDLLRSYHEARELDHRVRSKHLTETIVILQSMQIEYQNLHLLSTELVQSQLSQVKQALDSLVYMVTEDVGHDLTQFLKVTKNVYWQLHGEKHATAAVIINEVSNSLRLLKMMLRVPVDNTNSLPVFTSAGARAVAELAIGRLGAVDYTLTALFLDDPDSIAKLSSDEFHWVPESVYMDKSTADMCVNVTEHVSANCKTMEYVLSEALAASADPESATNFDQYGDSYSYRLQTLINQFFSMEPALVPCINELDRHLAGLERWQEQALIDLKKMQHSFQVSMPQSNDLSQELKELEYEMVYYRAIQANYSSKQSSKLEMAETFLSEKHHDSLAVLDKFITQVTDGIVWPIRNLIYILKSDVGNMYHSYLLKLANISVYYRTGTVESWARDIRVFRQPYVDLNTQDILLYKLNEDENLASWTRKVDLVTFSRNDSLGVLTDIIDDYTHGIIHLLQEVDTGLRAAEAGVASSLLKMKTNMQQFQALNRLDKGFVLNNMLKMNIFFSELKYEATTQQPAYDLPTYFSEIGGYMGLLIGASTLTVIEVLDLIVYNLLTKCLEQGKGKKQTANDV